MKDNVCKHFRGVSKPVCDQGISMNDAWEDQSVNFFDGSPCFGNSDHDCDYREFPTAEEIQAEDEKFEKIAGAAIVLRGLIFKKHGKVDVDIVDTIECPLCGRTVKYTIHGYNNHVHARCETEGCIHFME